MRVRVVKEGSGELRSFRRRTKDVHKLSLVTKSYRLIDSSVLFDVDSYGPFEEFRGVDGSTTLPES